MLPDVNPLWVACANLIDELKQPVRSKYRSEAPPRLRLSLPEIQNGLRHPANRLIVSPTGELFGFTWCYSGRGVALQAEILVLRHQLNVLRRRSPKRVVLGKIDRLVFCGLYRLSPTVLKGQKYALLSHKENLQGSARKNLKILLAANKRLNTAYVLKESFGQLWDYNREAWARKFFDNWRDQLKWQRLKPYETFAEMIDAHWDGIVAHCEPESKVPLGFVEGLNNKIRVFQRRAYGLRDEEYLRLKVLSCMLPEI
jgi:hypothetical protein